MTDHRWISRLLAVLPLCLLLALMRQEAPREQPSSEAPSPPVRASSDPIPTANTSQALSPVEVASAPDFGVTLSALVAERTRSESPDSTVVLPSGLDWDAIRNSPLETPPADRMVEAAEGAIEAPLPDEAAQTSVPIVEEPLPEPTVDPQPPVDFAEVISGLAVPLTDDVPPPAPAAEQPAVSPQPSPAQTTTSPVVLLPRVDDTPPRAALPVPNSAPQLIIAPANRAPRPNQAAPAIRPAALNTVQPAATSGSAPVRPAPRLSAARQAEIIAVSRLADAHTRRGFDLAGRRALFSARSEFIHALGMVAQGLDAIERNSSHVQAMNDGLGALDESDDFVADTSRLTITFDAVVTARPHKTPVLKGLDPGAVSAMDALQRYYSYAQERFVYAAGGQPAASMALLGLGKLHSALGKTEGRYSIAAEPKAIVFHQAALLVDSRNFMAANELGVLLAGYGKYNQAKAALVQSLRISGQPVTWQNLAIVHGQLGEQPLAQLALQEAEIARRRGVLKQPGPLGLPLASHDVQWTNAADFARVSDHAGAVQPAAAAQLPGGREANRATANSAKRR
ncbi:MAG: hypothetical protein K1X71_20360 [Pirellulales bacterium]|nr:hypothetical protein [Pirellulales bacterium]